MCAFTGHVGEPRGEQRDYSRPAVSVPRDSFRVCLHWRSRCQFPCLHLYIPLSATSLDFIGPCTQGFLPPRPSAAAAPWRWAALGRLRGTELCVQALPGEAGCTGLQDPFWCCVPAGFTRKEESCQWCDTV